jgi:hypothetical protein
MRPNALISSRGYSFEGNLWARYLIGTQKSVRDAILEEKIRKIIKYMNPATFSASSVENEPHDGRRLCEMQISINESRNLSSRVNLEKISRFVLALHHIDNLELNIGADRGCICLSDSAVVGSGKIIENGLLKQ